MRRSVPFSPPWLPELNRCWFAETVIAVRQEYGLTINRREAAALDAVLDQCEGCYRVNRLGARGRRRREPVVRGQRAEKGNRTV